MSFELNLIEFDQNGNLYVKQNEDIYMLCINSSDDLFLEKIINKNNNLITNYDNLSAIENKLKKAQKENKLHMKSMNEAINEIDKNDLEDYNEAQIQDIADTYNEFVHNPEYKYYNQDDHEFSDEDCYDDDIHNIFNFHYVQYDSINKSELLFDPPCYEFLVLDGTPQNSQLVIRSQLTNNQPFYRVSFYTNGYIELNIIGTKINSYNFNCNTMELNKQNILPVQQY
jgi:hypothetical protein